MAINYEKVGWDTTKYINPSNMNHMDEGIKAACDKADANESAISSVSNRVTNNEKAIEQTNSNLNTKIKNVSTGGSNDYIYTNVGFWSQGNFQIHIIDNSAIYVSINVISTKNSNDWIFVFSEAYRPLHTFYFDYYLGDTKYRGYILHDDGAVRFETLNTEDAISCSFCFPIK